MGVSHRVVSLISYWVITENETVVSRTTVSRVTTIQAQTDKNKASIAALDKVIQELVNDGAHVIFEGGKGEPKDWSERPFDHNPDFQEEFNHIVSNEQITETYDDFLPDVYVKTYLNMELDLPKRGEPDPQFARVTKHLRDANGLPIGKTSDKPIMDTHLYEV